MTPLSYHSLNLLLIALETMRLLALIVPKPRLKFGTNHTQNNDRKSIINRYNRNETQISQREEFQVF